MYQDIDKDALQQFEEQSFSDGVQEPKLEDDDQDEQEEEDQNDDQNEPSKPSNQTTSKATQPMNQNAKEGKTQKVQNQPFDEAEDVQDSEELDSGSQNQFDDQAGKQDEDSKKNTGGQQTGYQKFMGMDQLQSLPPQQKREYPGVASSANQGAGGGREGQDYNEDEEENIPGAYNPNDYANLQVSSQLQELFKYITRYKPQFMDLQSYMKPFIPDYIPAVGEVDAFIKIPKPDNTAQTLGLVQLDEPALNSVDPTTLEMLYIQNQKESSSQNIQPILVSKLQQADKNPKGITRWIDSVSDLHKGKGAPTVKYSRIMPDFDLLMQQFPNEVEQILREIPFPGPQIDMSTSDYAKAILTMLDIPVHSTKDGARNNSTIQSLHVFFTLFSIFKESIHFQQHQGGGNSNEGLQMKNNDIMFMNQD